MHKAALLILIVVSTMLIVAISPASAIDDMRDQETIAELLETRPVLPEEQAKQFAERQWAILPEFGYGPETRAKGGLKFQDRNMFDLGADLDVHGSYAVNQQESFTMVIATPHLLDDRAVGFFRLHYDHDPQLNFFSLGNNNVRHEPPALAQSSQDETSTEAIANAEGSLIVGWRPWERLALNVGISLLHVHIGRGDRNDGVPFTVDAYPHLTGIPGGLVNPVSLSLVWTTREDVVRPTQGWRIILVGAHTNKSMLSDFEFTRFVGDVSYLIPLWEGAHIIGLRVNGGYINGPRRQVPFWQLEELGGDDTLRGFFPHRFLGWSRVLGTIEYRARLFAFNFFSIWRVQVDGVAFGEMGRVFMSSSSVRDEFGPIPVAQPPDLPPTLVNDPDRRLVSHLQFSYGPGLRFALSQALVARLDAGFSNEGRGLLYLTFGQTF